MTTMSTIQTTADSVVTSLKSAVASANTLRVNLAAGNLAALNNTAWQDAVGETRLALDAAIADLAVAMQEFLRVDEKIGALVAAGA